MANERLKNKNRIWELDFIRGLCVLLMIFDHTMYDIADIFGYKWWQTAVEAGSANADFLHDLWQVAKEYYFGSTQSTFWGVLSAGSPIRAFVEPMVVVIFAIVCGISCSFSRNNLKRGIELGVLAGLITLVTYLLDTSGSMMITFGVFQMFTIAILLWCVIDFICRHDKMKTAFVCGIIGVIMLSINYVLVECWTVNNDAFSENSNGFFLGYFMLGGNKRIPSADYQPIFPYVGWMLIGAALGPIIYMKKKSLLPHLGKYDWYAPVNFWGKTAMWVYVLHQLIIGAILGLISAIFITPGDFIII